MAGSSDPGPRSPEPSTGKAPSPPRQVDLSGLFGFLFMVVLAGVIFAVNSPRFQAFLHANVTAIALVLGAVVLVVAGVLYFIPRTREWVKRGTDARRAGLIVFVVPVLLGVVVAITFLHPFWQILALRVSSVLVACLLPAAMYYLFIVTRKGSLLNEFIANMSRLGVLKRREARGGESSDIVIQAYLQKFEAAYGAIEDEVKRQLVEFRDPHLPYATTARTTVANVFVSEAAVPVLVATFLMALMWFIVLPPVTGDVPGRLWADAQSGDQSLLGRKAFDPNMAPVTAAFLGAYFFSLQLLFRRYVRRDLRPSAYVGAVIRVLLAVIGIWVISGVGWAGLVAGAAGSTDPDPKNKMLVLGFVIGVFPRVAFQLLEGVARKFLPAAVLPTFQEVLPISDLDGLTVWHEARLEDEDIENMPNMATADMLELMLNTRFAPDRIVDWVDQAILYTYLGPKEAPADSAPRRLLRVRGIRTATALTEAYANGVKRGTWSVEAIWPRECPGDIRSLIDAIETNPNLTRIRVWKGLPEASATDLVARQAVGPMGCGDAPGVRGTPLTR